MKPLLKAKRFVKQLQKEENPWLVIVMSKFEFAVRNV